MTITIFASLVERPRAIFGLSAGLWIAHHIFGGFAESVLAAVTMLLVADWILGTLHDPTNDYECRRRRLCEWRPPGEVRVYSW